MNVIAEISRINERELALGVPFEASWHQKYRESAWVYVGGLPFELSEGDVICVLSQFGEVEDVNLVRDGKTGKSKGFAFLKYADQRSTVLAVDNMNGARLLERVVRVDHVLKYKLPKELQDKEDAADSEQEDESETKQRGLPGHAYDGKELATKYSISDGQNVFAAPEESKKERKKRKKEDKKESKRLKKQQKIEAKQAELFEQIRIKRQAQREAEQREQERERRRGGEEQDEAALEAASASGWRGRLEPNAAPRTRPRDKASRPGDSRSGQDASYGGMNRVR